MAKQRIKTLMGWGYLRFEAKVLAEHYTLEQMRTITYLKNMTKSRRLYVINMRNRLIPEKDIAKRIRALYIRKGWVDSGDELSVWAQLRTYRKEAIISGDYVPPKTKGSHHPVKGQRKYQSYQSKARQQKKKLSKAKVSASQLGDVNSWIKDLQENRRKAVERGDSTAINQIDRQIANLRKSQK
jgi:hypothetical protein